MFQALKHEDPAEGQEQGGQVRQIKSQGNIALWARKEKNRINSHPTIHSLTSEGVSEVSK